MSSSSLSVRTLKFSEDQSRDFSYACRFKSFSEVRRLIEAVPVESRADFVNFEIARYGLTRLFTACSDGNLPLAQLLIEFGAKIDWRLDGLTELMSAAHAGHSSICMLLMRFFPSNTDRENYINKVSTGGVTALISANTMSHLVIIRILLAGGADPRKGGLPLVALPPEKAHLENTLGEGYTHALVLLAQRPDARERDPSLNEEFFDFGALRKNTLDSEGTLRRAWLLVVQASAWRRDDVFSYAPMLIRSSEIKQERGSGSIDSSTGSSCASRVNLASVVYDSRTSFSSGAPCSSGGLLDLALQDNLEG